VLSRLLTGNYLSVAVALFEFAKIKGHNEVGIPSPSSACGLYLGFALREWEPNSTQIHMVTLKTTNQLATVSQRSCQ